MTNHFQESIKKHRTHLWKTELKDSNIKCIEKTGISLDTKKTYPEVI